MASLCSVPPVCSCCGPLASACLVRIFDVRGGSWIRPRGHRGGVPPHDGGEPVQFGMLDIGSNSVKLQVVDARAGAPPLPVYAFKAPIRLAESMDPEGTISEKGTRKVIETVCEAMRVAGSHDLTEVIAFTTAWLRDAANGPQIRARLEKATGESIIQLSGED